MRFRGNLTPEEREAEDREFDRLTEERIRTLPDYKLNLLERAVKHQRRLDAQLKRQLGLERQIAALNQAAMRDAMWQTGIMADAARAAHVEQATRCHAFSGFTAAERAVQQHDALVRRLCLPAFDAAQTQAMAEAARFAAWTAWARRASARPQASTAWRTPYRRAPRRHRRAVRVRAGSRGDPPPGPPRAGAATNGAARPTLTANRASYFVAHLRPARKVAA